MTKHPQRKYDGHEEPLREKAQHSPLRGSALSSAFLQPSKNLATSDMCAGPAYSYQYYAFSPSKGHEPPARSARSPVSQQIGTMYCLVCITGIRSCTEVLYV
ncbi:hypothetical protein TsFJ059_002712 [Trichoderma semiorbis]|uniref:Uncharacterized protein n=1 Tax=Trichoderma semiorbis TaxID=1491008 RepID=A0A9P8KV90_9HYPO|nr:hypothetical protein TsFJ059_002712 [Trichoderma semiorbis]